MELNEDENIEWLMQSSATVEQVVAEDAACEMREDEDRQLKLFLQVLRGSFESEPIVKCAEAVGIVKSVEHLQTLMRKLKALGYFYAIRTSREYTRRRKVLTKVPEGIAVHNPYVVDRYINFYCSSGRDYNKQMRQRLHTDQRIATDCKAVMSVKEVTVFHEVKVPKRRNPRLQTLSRLRKDMATGRAPSQSELWVWVSLPKMHHHPVHLPGRQIDAEVKAAMHSLFQSGITAKEEIQSQLRLIVDREFARDFIRPSSDNPAFYPNQKVIYNHLRSEGLDHKEYKRKKRKQDEEKITIDDVNQLSKLIKIESC